MIYNEYGFFFEYLFCVCPVFACLVLAFQNFLSLEPNSVKMRQESIEQLETRIINLNTQLNELVLQHQKRLAELNAQKFTMPDVMTAQEVAEYLKTSKVTVYDLIKKGKLKAFTLGENKVRVQREELEKYICNFRTIIVDKFAIL